ncbi:hypothetical protein I6U51_06355 [Clostridium aciditolerans]|uniref:Uncharacterized protein n=1 Tax=Clostridium aciditolerans TaxID=339861 RepID=A0A934HUS9_9CLOT|nr:hypothetical protein [Clostridium aciditolerans]
MYFRIYVNIEDEVKYNGESVCEDVEANTNYAYKGVIIICIKKQLN